MSASDKLSSRKRSDFAAARRNAANIAASLREPSRQAETIRHHAALINAMNGSHDERGEQDALAVLEAFAMALGQIVCSMPDADRQGHLNYVMLRAVAFAEIAVDQRVGARFYVEPDDLGQGGHA